MGEQGRTGRAYQGRNSECNRTWPSRTKKSLWVLIHPHHVLTQVVGGQSVLPIETFFHERTQVTLGVCHQ
jgi:hypothetical protein